MEPSPDTVEIAGPAGSLAGILERPAAVRALAIVCHPHPAHGGTLRNTIVVRTARALRAAGFVTLRFNFRGVEGSAGTHDGELEVEDAAVALEFLRRRFPGVRAWAAGYSFGSRMAAALAAGDPAIERVVLIAPPVGLDRGRGWDRALRSLERGGLIVCGGADPFGTRADLERRVPDLPESLRVEEIPEADHFFRGKTPRVETLVRDYALASLGSPGAR